MHEVETKTVRRASLVRKLRRKVKTVAMRTEKWLRQRVPRSTPLQRRVALIVGCQRSGTTLMCEVFDQDPGSTVLWEINCLTGENDRRRRLKPFPEVNDILGTFRSPLVVLKPLLESQHTPEMLQNLPDAKAIWLFRHYRDVVRSKVRMFDEQLDEVRRTIKADGTCWRSEQVSDRTVSVLSKHYSDSMSREDAAALLWYARNALFFERDLDAHADVLPCKYEDFAANAEDAARRIYGFLGVEYPRRDITWDVDATSVGRGHEITLDPDIEALCDDLLNRLDQCWRTSSTAAGKTENAVECFSPE